MKLTDVTEVTLDLNQPPFIKIVGHIEAEHVNDPPLWAEATVVYNTDADAWMSWDALAKRWGDNPAVTTFNVIVEQPDTY